MGQEPTDVKYFLLQLTPHSTQEIKVFNMVDVYLFFPGILNIRC